MGKKPVFVKRKSRRLAKWRRCGLYVTFCYDSIINYQTNLKKTGLRSPVFLCSFQTLLFRVGFVIRFLGFLRRRFFLRSRFGVCRRSAFVQGGTQDIAKTCA